MKEQNAIRLLITGTCKAILPTLIDTRCCCSSARYQFISSRAFLRHSGKYCMSSPCPFASYQATTGPHCPPSPGRPVRAKRSLHYGYGVYSKLYVVHTRYRIFLYEAHNLRFFLRPRQLKLDSFNLIYLTAIAKSRPKVIDRLLCVARASWLVLKFRSSLRGY